MSSAVCLLLFLLAAVRSGLSAPDGSAAYTDLEAQIHSLEANISALWVQFNSQKTDGGVHIHIHDGHSEEDHHDHNHDHADEDHAHNGEEDDHHQHQDINLHMHVQMDKGRGVRTGEIQAHCEMTNNKFKPETAADHNVHGHVHITQQDIKSEVEFVVHLEGFDKTVNGSQRLLGMHLHEFGDLEESCNSLGGHFNPQGHAHGGPDSEHRHHGDMGNIEFNDEGKVDMTFTDNLLTLRGQDTVIGRSIVIHERADDFGQGNTTSSESSGDAGAKIACCVIGWAHH